MNNLDVKGYCEHIFKQAGLDSFVSWWSSEDPVLEAKPAIAVVQTPRLVIERAENICDDEASVTVKT